MEYVGAQERTEAETLLDADPSEKSPAAPEPSPGGRECFDGGAQAASGRPLRIACAVLVVAAAAAAAVAFGVAAGTRHTRRQRIPEGAVRALPVLRVLQDSDPCRTLLSLDRQRTSQGPGGFLGMIQGVLGRLFGDSQDTECTSEGLDGGSDCSAWGQNCVSAGCCKDEGYQCYRKNLTYGKCLPSCSPDAPSFFEDVPDKWTCGEVGVRTAGKAKVRVASAPRWVPMTCAKADFDCSASKCCSEPGQQCYEQAGGEGRCRFDCEAGPIEVEGRTRDWTCSVLGPGPPKEAVTDGIVSSGGGKNPVACSKDGEDCGRSTCCQEPGTMCYVKNSSFARCMASCPPPPDFSQNSSVADTWDCAPIGPRTKGEAVVKPAKDDLTWDELPSWVSTRCSGTAENCASSQCCKDPDMQCYEQEPGSAFCKPLCLKGMVEGGKPWGCKEIGTRTPKRCPKCAAKKSAPPTVVIPFFERDLCKLKYTAKSISVNDPHKFLGDVVLMWVSKRHTWEFQGQIDEILNSLKETREARIEDFTDKMSQAGLPGWHSQQIVKLKAASVVDSDYYIVLDSKNTIIHPLEKDPFFTPCGQAIIQAEWSSSAIVEPHIDWYDRSARALGVKSPRDAGAWDDALLWPASITPMVMHKQSVLDMLSKLGEGSDLGRLCDGNLCGLIGAYAGDGHGATEFTLYTLYVYDMIESGQFECIHAVEPVLGFEMTYSDKWYSELQAKIVKAGLKAKPSQLVVSNKDGWPVLWSPDDDDSSIPDEDQWPLTFTDVTRKWSAAIWRGEAADKYRLVKENLRTLSLIQQNGTKMFPLMFGAQPASLAVMNEEEKDEAIRDIIALYADADLLDDAEQDIIGCVVGYVN
mmetsp:Transcript_88762/g.247659  ORF Transcript_88762/g.247659 Transcript_88762/m.247659 type:complete len:861 (-) Transcript_88762:51-2633(-)